MRWKSLTGGIALALAAAGGCARPVYNVCESDVVTEQAMITSEMEKNPKLSVQPTIDQTPPPSNVYDPERKPRYMALAEAIAISLEQGTVGNQSTTLSNLAGGSATGIQTSSDQPVSFNGRTTGSSDAIRVLALDPASIGVGIDNALSKFDALWVSSASWQNTDRPIGTALDVFQAGGAAGVGAIQEQDVTASTSIVKPLPTGGVVGITFATPYTLTNLPARVNPAYTPSLQFAFEQPLLQGYGVEINQLRSSLPGSTVLNLLPSNANLAPTQEGILITRIRFDQQRAEFQRNVHQMLVNVEIAYWNLYNSYWQLYSQEQGMRQAYEAWKINLARFSAGRASIADLAQARGQYELFRGQRLQALSDLQENERQLRALLQLTSEDGTRIVPTDTPTLAPYSPDWSTALREALDLRPELYLARQDVKANQLNLVLQENSLMPDLRFAATYDINGIGTRLDGSAPTNAYQNMASDHFNNWGLQLRLTVPIGYRSAYANVRLARLQLARSYETLHDQELKIERFLALQYRRIFESYELIRIRRAQREAFAQQLRAQFEQFVAGRGTLDVLLEAQRFWASALADEYTAIRDYNNVLAGFEFAKGTILQHDNVVISEGALPSCVQKRAVEHLQERASAIELRERALPAPNGNCCEHDANSMPLPKGDSVPSVLDIPKSTVPSSSMLDYPKMSTSMTTMPSMSMSASMSTMPSSATKALPDLSAVNSSMPALTPIPQNSFGVVPLPNVSPPPGN
jgi:outer membrane protein TolC